MTLRPATKHRTRQMQLRGLEDRLTAELATHRLTLQEIVAEGIKLAVDGDAPVDIREGAERLTERAAEALRDVEEHMSGDRGNAVVCSVLFAETA